MITPWVVLVVICISISICYCANTRRSARLDDIENLTKSGIVPDLIDFPPRKSVYVDYEGEIVRQGNELSMKEVRKPPRVFFPKAKKGKLYTIFMIDPDAPSKNFPLVSPLLHYMVINAPYADSWEGETLVPYMKPSPAPGTGFHRYVFLVYEQRGKIHPSPLLPILSRFRYTLDNFHERSALIGPVAANFFFTQFSFEFDK